MRIFSRTLVVLLVLVIVAGISLVLFTSSLKPSYEGNLSLNGLQAPVQVFYDDYGVPHIYAGNEEDAMRVLGYVHAQDRLWQMELLRRLAAGRLSELFGEKTVATDKFFSGLGIEESAADAIAKLDTNSIQYQLSMAYLDGINQFIEQGATPVEFFLLGIDKEPYTLKDMYNVFGYMAFSFAIAHKTDPLLTELKDKLGDAYLREFDINIDTLSTTIKSQSNAVIETGMTMAVNKIMDQLPVPVFIGSNSWVIGPEKTKNGKVIFANDPHIGFSQPSVWYESHIVTPQHEMYGYNLALTPFPLLGHNRHYAYGLTMFENDDIDFYFEENDPENNNKYKFKDAYYPYEIKEKTLAVKDADTLHYSVKVSRHGPVMNGVLADLKSERPIAMNWVYTQLPNHILEVSFKMSHSVNLYEFKEGASLLHAPGLNIMYGDANDNIAWFASGKLYKYRDSLNTKMILNGADGRDEKLEYLDFTENPQAVNPDWHYVYSANNQPDSVDGMLYPGYYLPDDRAKRIVGLLEQKNDFTKEDAMQMINDVKSAKTPLLIKEVSKVIGNSAISERGQKALQILKDWDGNCRLESKAPVIYNRFIYELLKNTYKDEMGSAFKQFMATHLQKKVMYQQVFRDASLWWDDVHTKDLKESRRDIFIKSFNNAIGFLEVQLGGDMDTWTWNRVHTIEFKHPFDQEPLLRSFFNVGPFEINGGNEVINNQLFSLDSTGYYKVHAGPSTRRVIDFSDIENSMSILPTGQSGNPQSPHYADQAGKYLNGEFIKMLINEKEIRQSKQKLLFKPN